MEAETSPAPPLPDDVLAAILGRLPPRALAASRRVCRAWRAAVDARGLLLRHALPRAVRGVFVNFIDYRRPRFFARPSPEDAPAVDGGLGFLPRHPCGTLWPVRDHCNGLLLYGTERALFVANPATRRWQRLPPRDDGAGHVSYLAFDPAASPHYEVVLIPHVPEKPTRPDPRGAPQIHPRERKKKKKEARRALPRRKGDDPVTAFNLSSLFSSLDDTEDWWARSVEEDEEGQEGYLPTITAPPPASSPEPEPEPEDPCRFLEWPPSPWTVPVFSSSAGRWEERSFVREGDAVGITVEDARADSLRPVDWGPRWRYGVYWQGAFYVHCRGAFVMRLSLTDGKYQVIRPPIDIEEGKHVRPCLGRSEKGVYFATIQDRWQCLLRVWILSESCGHMVWVLKHHIDLEPTALWAAVRLNYHHQIDGPWRLDGDSDDEADNRGMLPKENLEWDSDNDNVVDDEEDSGEDRYDQIYFLGFHPCKEVVFLKLAFTGIAFHLNTSKVQYLGRLRPKDYYYTYSAGVYESFIYTPCLIGELPETGLETHLDD
ncbi:hypothetical protein ACP4OV_002697 [Aristida adscensionis]